MNILKATEDPNLFGPWFKDRVTWAAWFAFLAALFGLPMTDEQLAIYRRHTGRERPPERASVEAWLCCGRRAGKSFLMALVAVFCAVFRDYRPYLQPGERATVRITAADRRQARVIFRYVRALLRGIPMLAGMVERETNDTFDLNNMVTIEVGTASFRLARGYTYAAFLIDEVAFLPTDDAAEPDYELIIAARPGLASIPGAPMLCGSSPYARRGALWDAYRRCWANEDAPLFWKAATLEMNPTIDRAIVEAEYEKDPSAAAAEWGGDFRRDLEGYVDPNVIEAATIEGRHELPPTAGIRYVAFTDPAGGSGADSYTTAVAHRETDGRVVVDAVRERRPPFSPSAVIEEHAAMLKTYGVESVTGDRWGGEFPREAMRNAGIEYVTSEKPKSDLYRDALPLLNSGRVELLALPRLASQLCGLERRTSRGGRDSIDHAPGGHDDVANAVCGVLCLAAAAEDDFLLTFMRANDCSEAEIAVALAQASAA
jgi:hypothetical protein